MSLFSFPQVHIKENDFKEQLCCENTLELYRLNMSTEESSQKTARRTMLIQKMITKPKTLLNRKVLSKIPLSTIVDIVGCKRQIPADLGYAALSLWAELQCIATKCKPTRENKRKMLGYLDIHEIIDVSDLSTDCHLEKDIDDQLDLPEEFSHLVLNKATTALGSSQPKLQEKIARTSDAKIKIIIKTLTGYSTPLVLSPANTVGELKLMFEGVVGIPVELQTMIYRGKQLLDYPLLQDYGICDGSTVIFKQCLRGC